MQQIGRIALWEAYKRFDPEKGHFPSYAKRYISGRMLQAVNGTTREQSVPCSHTILQDIGTYEVTFLESCILEEQISGLSNRERLFVECVIFRGEPQIELARREGVSYETVRSWRKSALKKLREKVEKMES